MGFLCAIDLRRSAITLPKTMASLSRPQLSPESVPGGSLIGSVNSHFAAAAITIYQAIPRVETQSSTRSAPPTYKSFISDEPPLAPSTESPVDATLVGVIQNLPRAKIEALVTQAWVRNIPNQSDDKLRELVKGAMKKGILNHDDIGSASEGSFTCLPTDVIPQTIRLTLRFKSRYCHTYPFVN
jgi:hypothetical protein